MNSGKTKIVVLDGYTLCPGDLNFDALRAFGDVTVYDRTPEELVVERIGDAPVILTNKVRITREVMLACPTLRYVGVTATGFNVVDTAAATELPLFLYETGERIPMREAVEQAGAIQSAAIITGPEGGFEPFEAELARHMKLQICSMVSSLFRLLMVRMRQN